MRDARITKAAFTRCTDHGLISYTAAPNDAPPPIEDEILHITGVAVRQVSDNTGASRPLAGTVKGIKVVTYQTADLFSNRAIWSVVGERRGFPPQVGDWNS
jgi:hypothetical protein